ncbi:hypothetical protein TRVL_03495 [Trypanosoma vivax]|nr:hypothetical protein TRVL_03495 [Trypanosoma vivax]
MAEGVFIASSSIDYCERNNKVDPVPCEKKMVVTLSVDAGQDAGVEEVVLVREASDKTRDDDKRVVEFEPIYLTTKKTRVRYHYPLFYERNFNAKPYEEQIPTSLFDPCVDKPGSSKATCGIAHDNYQKPIPFSEGFCCNCGACQLAGICPSDSRGLGSCNIFQTTGSASCLRLGELWYSGYNIGQGTAWYRLHVTLRDEVDNNSAASTRGSATMSLGPDQPADFSEKFGAWARLVGDFVPPEMPLDLTGKMLFTPATPRRHERVIAGSREWMFLDKHLVSLQGRECNKIGVSYEGFVTQGSRCVSRPGTCLADQLEDYRQRDVVAEAHGRRGKYMARLFGDMYTGGTRNTSSPYIAFWLRGSLSTMVTITINADSLRYVQSVSPGTILRIKLMNKTVFSYTRSGVVSVTVLNTGRAESQYFLAVRNCSVGVHPIAAQTINIPSGHNATCLFDLYVQEDVMTPNVKCHVELRDARGNVTDTSLFYLRLMPVNRTSGSQGREAPDGQGASVRVQRERQCSRCSWYNLFCYLSAHCWWQPAVYAAAIMGVLILVQLLMGGGSVPKQR